MRLGIFAKTFTRPSLEQTFAAVKSCGLDCIQFNFSCAGLPALPDAVDTALTDRIRHELSRCSLSNPAVSGTCNLIHPNPEKRSKDLARLKGLIRATKSISAQVVTLCTGTRDPSDMWRPHAANHSPEAWNDLVAALEQLLPMAEQCSICLGVEPEPANVIDSAAKARKLLDELKSPWLKIVFDAANLVDARHIETQEKLLHQAVDLLGKDIVLAHAKDVMAEEPFHSVAPGKGALNYPLYLELLKEAGFDGPLILHGLTEAEVPVSVAFVRSHLKAADASAPNQT